MYIFLVQDTLTILCDHFPLISTINDTSLQCARLRIDENIPSSSFNLHNASQIILFVIIDQSSSDVTPVNIRLNLNQSSINEIRLSLLVTHSNFTINNQSTTVYSSYDIPVLHWKNSEPNTYNLIDLLHLNNHDYEIVTSLCQWNVNRWNRLFNSNSSNKPPYVYILKTTSADLIFTLTDTKTRPSPSPYINILYCVPYKLGTTELVLIICFGILFILCLIVLGILHYLKDEDSLTRYFQRRIQNKSILCDRTNTD